MAELDLIPTDYRNWMTRRGMTRQYVVAFVILNIVILTSSGVLAMLSRNAMVQVRELQSQSAITAQQQSRLEQLTVQQKEFERRWSLLQLTKCDGAGA